MSFKNRRLIGVTWDYRLAQCSRNSAGGGGITFSYLKSVNNVIEIFFCLHYLIIRACGYYRVSLWPLKVVRTTGFMKGLFTEAEMNSDNVKVCA